MEAETLSNACLLAAKKNKVMEAVGGIVKTGRNRSQGYTYAEEAEVVRVIRKAFIDVGIGFAVSAANPVITHIIPTRSGQMQHFCIELTIWLIDIDTGYRESYPWLGMAADSGDKALYKAYTGGCKYFLMKTFLLPTGDDPESAKDPEPTKLPPKPNEQEEECILAIGGKLFDSIPNHETEEIDLAKVSAILYALAGRYPNDTKTAGTTAAWLISQGKMKEICKKKKEK